MPDLSHPPSADGVRDLPEEIAAAIESLLEMQRALTEAKASGDQRVLLRAGFAFTETRDALTAAILSRLGEVEAGRMEAERERDDARCVGEANARAADANLDAIEAVETARDAALARGERLEKALAEAADWHDSKADNLRGRPQSIDTRWRTHKHVEEADRIRSALTEAGHLALKDA